MQAALKLTTTVHPGGRIEVIDIKLPVGKAVDIVILFPQEADPPRRSVMDVLAEAPGRLAFQTADEVDAYLNEERDAWER